MTGRSFQQTATAAPCGSIAPCSGAAVAATPASRLCVEGGVAGSSSITFSARATRVSLMFQFAPGQVGWSAGNYTPPLNIITANAGITVIGGYVCRLSAACGGAVEVGHVTGLSISLGTTGVKSGLVIPGGLSIGDPTDLCYIEVLTLTAGTTQTAQIRFDQVISTPIMAALEAVVDARAGGGSMYVYGTAGALVAAVAARGGAAKVSIAGSPVIAANIRPRAGAGVFSAAGSPVIAATLRARAGAGSVLIQEDHRLSMIAAYSDAVAKASHPRQMVEIDVDSLTSMLSLTETEVSILTQDLAPEEPVTTVPDFRARLEAMTSSARTP